jgi:phenylpyruvate tautomerase PptA (4-oxalocrotonate tautomerase family)
MPYQSPRTPVGAYGLRPEQIHVYFHAVADDQWGRGVLLASEREGER